MGSRKSDIDPFERGLLVAKMLLMGKPISTKVLRDEFGVSKASAKRAMVVIELALNADAVVGERGQTILAAHPGRLQTKA